MSFKVLITNQVPPSHVRPLEGLAEVIMGPGGGPLMPRDEVLKLAPELDGIINQAELKVDEEVLDAGKKLQIIANVAMGADNMDLELMAKRGVWASNTPGQFGDATADHTLGLVLCIARKILPGDRYVRSGQWPADGFQPGPWDGMLLTGKVWGVVGFGQIGRRVAQRARAFGMQVLYHDAYHQEDPENHPIEKLLSEAHVLSLHVPLTEGTHHLINKDTLAKMRKGAILLNLSRGKVVKEDDLVEALKSGQLAGAGLDVFENEPHVHPELVKLDNVVMTPHVGGGTVESRAAARHLAAQNVALVLQGQPPRTPVNDPQKYATRSGMV